MVVEDHITLGSPTPRKRGRWAVVSSIVGVLMLGGVAFAAWTATASNQHGYSKYGSLQAVTTVDISATVTGNCFPSSNCDLKFRFSNPNPQAVTVSTVGTAGATFSGCTTPAASINGGPTLTINQSVPGNGTADFTATNAIAIGSGASNDCQAAVLDVGGLVVTSTT